MEKKNKKKAVADLKPARNPKGGGKDKNSEPYLVVKLQDAQISSYSTSSSSK